MVIYQQSNHNIQQSLLEEWMKSHPDFYILNFTTFKQRFNNQKIKDISTTKESLICCSKTQYYKTIFANKYVLDNKEQNINGNGKRIKDDIEDKILAEYRDNKKYSLNTIYNYFALQLTRSDALLLNSYSAFLSLFGHINDKIYYSCFKEFYNAFLTPNFIKTYNKFIDDKYEFFYYQCPQMVNLKNEIIKPYLWIGEANVFEIDKLGLNSYVNDFDNLSLTNIYVCLLSPEELIFLYPLIHTEEHINQVANIFTNYWNNVALGFLCKTLIFPQSSIETVSSGILQLYNSKKSYFINNEQLANLENLSKIYEQKNK